MACFCIVGYNEEKKEILSLLNEMGAGTATITDDHLGRSHESVVTALLRYHRQGLVSRHNRENKTRVYELTESGGERL